MALKTINLLAGEKGQVPIDLAIVPLPKMNMISIVKYIEIHDKEARGNAWDASLTVLFDQSFLPYIHKYIDKFSEELNKLTKEILDNEEKKKSDLALSKLISSFYFDFEKNIKTYISTEEAKTISPSDERINILKNTIEEFQNLIGEYVKDSEGFSQDELKDALKLSYELGNLDLKEVTSSQIRKMAEFAEKLKIKKDMITTKRKKLDEILSRINGETKNTIEEKLDTITDIFDGFLDDIQDSMERLSEKGSSILFFKKIYDSGQTEAKILATSKELKEYIKFLKNINNLPPFEFKKLKNLYLDLERTRELRKMQEVGKTAQKIGDILHIKHKRILKLTRDPRLKEALNDIFKISSESKKEIIIKEKNKPEKFELDEEEIPEKKKTVKKTKKSKKKKKQLV